MTETYLTPAPVDTQTVLTRLQEASTDVGSGGGGGTFLRVDDRTGEVTFGQERAPLPPGGRYVVGLHTFAHGYIDMQGGQVVERKVVPMHQQSARPTPAGGYGSYEGGGPRNVTEITLASIDENGFELVFTAWGISSANRLRNLLEAALLHAQSDDGQAGFIHPVIIPKSSHYPLKARVERDGTKIPARNVHHFDYDVVDWLHKDGKVLLTKRGEATTEPAEAQADASDPWRDDEMTGAEQEMLGAA